MRPTPASLVLSSFYRVYGLEYLLAIHNHVSELLALLIQPGQSQTDCQSFLRPSNPKLPAMQIGIQILAKETLGRRPADSTLRNAGPQGAFTHAKGGHGIRQLHLTWPIHIERVQICRIKAHVP